MFSWSSHRRPLIVQSPMAGYTDSAFKQIIRICSKETIVVTEFVSADAIYYGSEKTKRMMEFDESEHPVILQIFGKDPDRMVNAAKIAASMGYDGVDINMGCPAKKVIQADHGSALVKIENRAVAMKIVSDMARSVKIPISVKTRIGWENSDDLIDFCTELEKNGCASIAIHGRTTKQGYRGDADWNPMYALKSRLQIPVLGNGDIFSVSDFRKKIAHLDGVFVARGSIGDPWLLQDIHDYSSNKKQYEDFSDEALDQRFPRGEHISWEKKKPIVLRHLELAVGIKGEQHGVLEMRKHLAAYIKGVSNAKEIREKIMKLQDCTEIQKVLRDNVIILNPNI